MNKHQEALSRLKLSVDAIYSKSKLFWDIGIGINGREPTPILSEKDFNVITELIDEKLEFESLKEELIVDSEWECIADCYVMYYDPHIIRIGDKFRIKTFYSEGTMEITNKSFVKGAHIPRQQFLRCFRRTKRKIGEDVSFYYDEELNEVTIYNEHDSVIAVMPDVYSLEQAEELAEEVYGGYLIGLWK